MRETLIDSRIYVTITHMHLGFFLHLLSDRLEGVKRFVEVTYVFMVGCSLALLFTVLFNAVRNFSVAGSKAFLLQIILVTIWSVGALMEMLSPTEHGMFFWRNVEQIGVFLLPVACVYFAVDYAQYDRLKKYLPLLLIIPVITIVLIFMDSSIHILRSGYIVSYSPLFGKALSVHLTNVGSVVVAYNYILAFVSLVILYVFSRQVNRNLRRQVLLILFAIGLVFLLGFLKTVFLEGTSINIPIVTIYLPGGLILYFNLYRNNFFRVSPIARDKVFDVMDLGIVVTDNLGMIADINPYAAQLLGSIFEIREKPTGKKMDEVFGEYPDWVELTQNGTDGETEVKIKKKDLNFIHIRVYPLKSHKGTQVGSVTIMRNVTVLRMQESALKIKAEIDSLTGLLNRDSFMGTFARMLSESASTGKHVSVLMMDLDKFKVINDTYGHDSGDKMIKAFADVLREVLRYEDAIARIGGDEFAAVLPGVDKKEAIEIASRILETANKSVVYFEAKSSAHLSLSIGICDNAVAKSEENMLKCADKAMYMAKSKRGNCCVAWEYEENPMNSDFLA